MIEGTILLPQWIQHFKTVSTITVHPSGSCFATGGYDGYIKIWSIMSLSSPTPSKLLAIFQNHKQFVNCARFSPDGKYLATCGDDSSVFLCHRSRGFFQPGTFGIPEEALKPNKPIHHWVCKPLFGNQSDVSGIDWFSDSKKIASCAIDGTVVVWDVKTQNILWTYKAGMMIQSISVDPLGKFVGIQLSNSTLVVIDSRGKLFKEVSEGIDVGKEIFSSRISWTPDGSFLGANSGNIPFFRRDSFTFAFFLSGHPSQSTSIACPRTLFKLSDQLCTLIAIADKIGCISIWTVGADPRPLLILEKVSSTTIYDLSWSKDGKYLFAALESDPISSKAGVVAVRFDSDFLTQVSEEEMNSIRVVNDFKPKISQKAIVSQILKSLTRTERDVAIEIPELSWQEIQQKQKKSEYNGKLLIEPVLLTAVEKQNPSFFVKIPSFHTEITKSPSTLQRKFWPKPAVFPDTPSHVLEGNDYFFVAVDGTIIKLSARTGRRMSVPFVIGAACRHLSRHDNYVLAVGSEVFVFNVETMFMCFRAPCPRGAEFVLRDSGLVEAHCGGKIWVWSDEAKAWIGGTFSESGEDVPFCEIEAISKRESEAEAAAQWYDASLSIIFKLRSGLRKDAEDELQRMQQFSVTECSSRQVTHLRRFFE